MPILTSGTRPSSSPGSSSPRRSSTAATRPELGRADDQREHGRGLAIVDAAATRWGTDHRGTHKAVWFELSSSVPA